MRRKDREVTDRGWMEDVLRRAQVVTIGMVDEDGKPYLVPFGFGYEDGVIYLHGAAEGRKNDILARNPDVCFQAYVDAELLRAEVGANFSMHYKSVTGFGRLTTITDRAGKDRALAILMRHYDGPHTPLGENHAHLWVARIDIESMTGKSNPPHKPAVL